MYIRANRDALIRVLNKVGGVVERRHTLPILGNLLISAGDSSVQVTGTDLEVEIRARLSADIEQAGETTLPARKFIDICRAIPDGADIAVKVERERAVISSGRSRFTLSTLPAADFPLMDGKTGDQRLEIKQGRLKRLFDKTGFAMAHQDVRYYLNGLLLEVRADRLLAVATDGHRLAKLEEEVSVDVEGTLQLIIPRKTVLEFNRLLGSGDESVRIDLTERMFRAYLDDTILTSKLVDGRFPDYERVIPHASGKTAVVDRDAFRQALLRTSILSNEKYKGVRLSFGEGQLALQAHNPEQEEAEEELELEYGDEPTAVGFNVGYLLDVLGVLEKDKVEIEFTDSNSSAVLRSREDDRETYVVMPMRL